MKAEQSNGALIIRGGRLVDPSQGLDRIGDLLLVDGRVAGAIFEGRTDGLDERQQAALAGAAALPAEGKVVAPGFVDLHCHLREPGFEQKETIATGSRAAARGGFTTICCMPNTKPTIDSPATVDFVLRAAAGGPARVLPIACVTRGEEGKEMVQMAELAEAGVVGFSDDGRPVAGSRMMRHALEYARMLGMPIIDHCEDPELVRGAEMNEGPVAAKLGLRGNPAAAEDLWVARDLALAELAGGWIHIAHASTAGAVDLIRRARARGVRVTAEVTPHHLTLTDEWVTGVVEDAAPWMLRPPAGRFPYDTNTRVAPPLRSRRDLEALLEGLADGTIDAIATDHAPHAWEDKACEYGLAANGITGFETALGALLGPVHGGQLGLPTLVSKLACEPAALLREAGLGQRRGEDLQGLGTLQPGAPADVVVFDLQAEWTVEPEELVSQGKNTPLAGVTLRGRVTATLFGGRIVFALAAQPLSS